MEVYIFHFDDRVEQVVFVVASSAASFLDRDNAFAWLDTANVSADQALKIALQSSREEDRNSACDRKMSNMKYENEVRSVHIDDSKGNGQLFPLPEQPRSESKLTMVQPRSEAAKPGENVKTIVADENSASSPKKPE